MKSKIKLVVTALMLAVVHLVATAAGKSPNTEERTSKPYHYLNLEGAFDVRIEQSEVPGVIVEGNKFQISNTITILRNDTLFVYQTNVVRSEERTNIVIQ